MKFILASSSPRRKLLLKTQGYKFSILNPSVKEIKEKSPTKSVVTNSYNKALKISKIYKEEIILSADTIVVYKNEILEKPKNKKEALIMLKKLNNKKHTVITAYIVMKNLKVLEKKLVKSEVYFGNFKDIDYINYIKTKEPFDKAGGYGIQDKGAKFIKKIKGSYSNIVGLPIFEVVKSLKKVGINA